MGLKLGDFSPMGGAITGEGIFGKGLAAFENATGMGGLMPKLAKAAKDKKDREAAEAASAEPTKAKRGGTIKKMAEGGSVSSASKRGDGCATKGKTKGRFV